MLIYQKEVIMAKTQFATRVEEDQAVMFKSITTRLGTTPADALRMFVSAFNEAGGFPFDVRVARPPRVEAFDSEEDAIRFASELALETAR